MATYNMFELAAMMAPDDNYGYRARAAREGRDYDERAPEETEEPACTCVETGAELFDARGCEAHDASSEWNARLRAVTAGELYDGYRREAA